MPPPQSRCWTLSRSIFDRFLAPSWGPSWSQVGAKLSLKSTPKLLAFSNPISKPLGFDVGSILGRFSGSKIDPGTGSKLKRPMCTKPHYLQYETPLGPPKTASQIHQKSISRAMSVEVAFQNPTTSSVNSKMSRLAPNMPPTWPQHGPISSPCWEGLGSP